MDYVADLLGACTLGGRVEEGERLLLHTRRAPIAPMSCIYGWVDSGIRWKYCQECIASGFPGHPHRRAGATLSPRLDAVPVSGIPGIPAAGEVRVTTSNRNFRGKMGEQGFRRISGVASYRGHYVCADRITLTDPSLGKSRGRQERRETEKTGKGRRK